MLCLLLGLFVASHAVVVPSQCGSSYVTAPGSSAKNYYVATNGSNTADGLTPATAWKTIQYAANQITGKSALTVNVMAGVYAEQVKITAVGSAAAWVVFQGNGAIIDGTTISPPCASCSGLVWIAECSYFVFRGFEVHTYFSSSTTIEPVGIYISAATGPSTHLQIYENWIHDIRTTGTTTSHNAHGLVAYGTYPISNLVISHNEVSNCVLGFSESLTIDGDVSQFEISDNLVHDNNNIGILAAGWYKTARAGGTDSARQGAITRNIVYNISSLTNPAYKERAADGIYCDGCTYVNITNNIVFNADLGLEVTSENAYPANASNVRVEGNVFYNNAVVGISTGGYDNKRGQGKNNLFIHNVLFHNDVQDCGNGQFMFQCYVYNTRLENNTFVSPSITISSVCQTPLRTSWTNITADQDRYVDNFEVDWVDNNAYVSLASFRSGTGQESAGSYDNSNPTSVCSYTSQCVAGSLQLVCPSPTAPTTPPPPTTATPTTRVPSTRTPTSRPTTRTPSTKMPTSRPTTRPPTTRLPTGSG